MTSNEKKRYWLYVRVASESLGPSSVWPKVDTQLASIRQYASEQGWEIAGAILEPQPQNCHDDGGRKGSQ